MEPPAGLSAGLPRLRAVLTDGSDVSGVAVDARWDWWRRRMNQVVAHTLVADAAVTVLVAIISAPWLIDHHGHSPGIWVLQVVLVVPLVWRRRYPVAVFFVLSVVALVLWLIGVELVADVALLVSLYTVASHRPRVVALGAASVVEVGAVMAVLRWNLGGSWIRGMVFLSGLVAAAFLLGTDLRSRRGHVATLMERAARLERERDQQALIAVAAERTRIAREMHDVIAHSLAVIISLADGASAKLHSDPERAAAAIRNVSNIGRQALGDTRRLLGVLRADDPTDGLTPQPGIAQITWLLDQARATGLAASLVTNGQPRPLPPGTELTAFRIVQEATTNTVKHAVEATVLGVILDYGADMLWITVTDNGRSVTQSGPGTVSEPSSGHGLGGMRERAALYNGTVMAGSTAHGWSVQARLPIAPTAETVTVAAAVPVGPGR
jgi:signal transduction histidine kinase